MGPPGSSKKARSKSLIKQGCISASWINECTAQSRRTGTSRRAVSLCLTAHKQGWIFDVIEVIHTFRSECKVQKGHAPQLQQCIQRRCATASLPASRAREPRRRLGGEISLHTHTFAVRAGSDNLSTYDQVVHRLQELR